MHVVYHWKYAKALTCKLPPVDGFKPNIHTRCCSVCSTMCHDVPSMLPLLRAKHKIARIHCRFLLVNMTGACIMLCGSEALGNGVPTATICCRNSPSLQVFMNWLFKSWLLLRAWPTNKNGDNFSCIKKMCANNRCTTTQICIHVCIVGENCRCIVRWERSAAHGYYERVTRS